MASTRCVRANSVHLFMTNHCLLGLYSKIFRPRSNWSMLHLILKNTHSPYPEIVRLEKRSTWQFLTRYIAPGGSKPSSAISARDDFVENVPWIARGNIQQASRR